MTVVALVGAQYGSEGKGAIAAAIADQFQVHVRTGAPNAGHTYYIDGQTPQGVPNGRAKVVARSVPCGASNPQATLVIGPGGVIDVDLLVSEVQELDALGLEVSGRLMVDAKALVIDKIRHHDYENGVKGKAHEMIGSTGEGVGIARMAHLSRGVLAHDWAWGKIEHAGDPSIREYLDSHEIDVITGTSRLVTSWIDIGQKVLLEGTQGSGLSSVHGPWPYCTSTDTNSAQMLVDAGISPARLTSTVLVARSYPIRVAGNSGPLEKEITWEEIGVKPEHTTVTKKERRVGRWDDDLFERAVVLNGPSPRVALTFADYLDPFVTGITEWDGLTKPIIEWIRHIEWKFGVNVCFVGTGPDSVAIKPGMRW